MSAYIVEQLPLEVDKEVGREARKELLGQVSVDTYKTERLQAFYNELGFDTKTKVYVLKGEEFNAVALPDNSIFVFEQVLKEVQSYSELAALLGHEYAHIRNRHGMKMMGHALFRILLVELLTGGDNTDSFVKNSGELLLLGYSRKFEMEADKDGLALLGQKQIDLNGMVELFERMAKFEQREEKRHPYLSTHPDARSRLEAIKIEIGKMPNNHVRNDRLFHLFTELKFSAAEKTAVNFLKALKEQNYEKAKQFGTQDTRMFLKILATVDTWYDAPQEITELINAITALEIKEIGCTEYYDNRATCRYCCIFGGEETLRLVKKGGKWLVDMEIKK